jgi:7-cyano-7-deazaguanine synthase
VKKAIVLLSGGLDSAVTLYFAKKQGFHCRCLIFDYGQRHKREIESARRVARAAGCAYKILRIKLPWNGSSLLDKSIKIPLVTRLEGQGVASRVPSTYVPGRNIIFLSLGISYAEAINAKVIFIGANAVDFSGYPDCRPEFYRAFSKVIVTGTKAGIKGEGIKIKTPLISKTKAQIIRLGAQLGVPFKLTWSCYKGGKRPCGKCDSCFFRAKGFAEAGIYDPALK